MNGLPDRTLLFAVLAAIGGVCWQTIGPSEPRPAVETRLTRMTRDFKRASMKRKIALIPLRCVWPMSRANWAPQGDDMGQWIVRCAPLGCRRPGGRVGPGSAYASGGKR